MEEERSSIILRTYHSVWKVDKKIYSIENIKLWIPVSTNDVLYFGVGLVMVVALGKILPFSDRIPFLIKYGGIPYGIMKFLTKQKLDGKLPHKFFKDYVIYLLSPKKSVRFGNVATYGEGRFTTPVAMRDIELINKTEKVLKKGNKANKRIFWQRERKGKRLCTNSL